jgi:hypothetical protein
VVFSPFIQDIDFSIHEFGELVRRDRVEFIKDTHFLVICENIDWHNLERLDEPHFRRLVVYRLCLVGSCLHVLPSESE